MPGQHGGPFDDNSDKPGVENAKAGKTSGTPDAPGVEAARKGGLPWGKIVLGALGAAGLYALTQCGGEKEQQPIPPVPTDTPTTAPTEGAKTFFYRVAGNTALRTEGNNNAAAVTFVAKDSCLQSVSDSSGTPERTGTHLRVQGMATNGTDASEGWISRNAVRNVSGYTTNDCRATFLVAATSADEKQVPSQFFTVNGSARFYAAADETSPSVGISGQGSCVMSTGIQRGDLMQVKVNNTQVFWTPVRDYAPAPAGVTASTCAAKLDM